MDCAGDTGGDRVAPPPATRVAVVGLGRAGQARLRAVAAAGPTAALAAAVSRRGGAGGTSAEALPSSLTQTPPPAAATTTLEARLAAAGADAVIVCTENATHADVARRALAAGAHALVEYPLALSLSAGEALFAAARAARLVLRVEHIELAAAAHETAYLRQAIAVAAAAGVPVASARVEFSGPPLPRSWGHPAFAGIARLTRAWAALGPLAAVGASWIVAPAAVCTPAGAPAVTYDLAAELASVGSARVSWRERRVAGAARSTTFIVTLADGRALEAPPPPGGPPVGLFDADLRAFLGAIAAARRCGRSGSADDDAACAAADAAEAAELAWMRTADAVARACPAPHDVLDGDVAYAVE